MPQGFFIAPGSTSGVVLCYDPKQPTPLNATPLTVVFQTPRRLKVELRGTLQQFDSQFNLKSLETLFIDKTNFVDDSKFLLQCFNVYGEQKGIKIENKLLETFLQTPKNGRALFYLLQNESLDTIAELLQLFESKDDSFKKAFLDNSEDWTIFLSQDNQQVLHGMQFANNNEKKWWEALSGSHMQHQPEANLHKLWHDFQYFLQKFYSLMGENNLADYPFEAMTIYYMPTHLQVFLDYLEAHPNPRQSVSEWPNLDYSPTGFSYALQNGFCWVSDKMKLSPYLSKDEISYDWERDYTIYLSSKKMTQSYSAISGRRADKDSKLVIEKNENDKDELCYYNAAVEKTVIPVDVDTLRIQLKEMFGDPQELEPYGSGYKLGQKDYHRFVAANIDNLETAYQCMGMKLNTRYHVDKALFRGHRYDDFPPSSEHLVPLSYDISFLMLLEYQNYTLEQLIPLWYRYLGKQDYCAELADYETFINVLNTTDWDENTKKRMLLLVALATTHSSGATDLHHLSIEFFVSNCVNFVKDSDVFDGLISEWSNDKFTFAQWSLLYEDTQSGYLLAGIKARYGDSFLTTLDSFSKGKKQAINVFFEKIKLIDESPYSDNHKKLLLTPAFLLLSDENAQSLINDIQYDPNLITQWVMLSRMPIAWETAQKVPQYNELKTFLLSFSEKTVTTIQQEIRALFEIQEKGKSFKEKLFSSDNWLADFSYRYALDVDISAGDSPVDKKELYCKEILDNLMRNEHWHRPLVELLGQYGEIINKWPLDTLYKILDTLQTISNGPPKQQFPFSLLKYLVSDSFWSLNIGFSERQYEKWQECFTDILSSQLSKKEKKSRLIISLRLISQNNGDIDDFYQLFSDYPDAVNDFADIIESLSLDDISVIINESQRFIAANPDKKIVFDFIKSFKNTAPNYLSSVQFLNNIDDANVCAHLIKIVALAPCLPDDRKLFLSNCALSTLKKIESLLELSLLKVSHLSFVIDKEKNEQVLIEQLNELEKAPFGNRDTISADARIVENIADIECLSVKNTLSRLSYFERLELVKKITIITLFGTQKAIPGPLDAEYPCASELSIDELRELLAYYKPQLALPDKKEYARLIVITLVREAMYRTWGHMPNSTQIISILDNQASSGNAFTQLIAGEGKSTTLAMSAALHALEGKTVDVCTRNEALAARDLGTFASFFKLLNLPAFYLTASCLPSDYNRNGIYYSDMSQRALLEARFAIAKESEKAGHPKKDDRILLLDEGDTCLDETTHYRETVYIGKVEQQATNHLYDVKWLYIGINQFIDNNGIQVDSAINDDDISALREYLLHVAGKDISRCAMLEDISDAQWLLWLKSAQIAMSLKNEHDYLCDKVKRVIDEEEIWYSQACILDPVTHRILSGPQWSDGVQQLVHARLEVKRNNDLRVYPFLIEKEVSAITAIGLSDFIDCFGHFWGVTGTLGGQPEMLELSKRYSARMHRMPTHLKNQLHVRASVLANDTSDFLKSVAWQVETAIQIGQPVLIHVKNREESTQIKNYLVNQNLAQNLQECHAEEAIAGHEQICIEYAGQPGIVTISSIFNRGTNIPLSDSAKERGLLSIYTDADDLRECEQGFRRSARYGAAGEAILIVNRQHLCGLQENERQNANEIDIHRQYVYENHAFARSLQMIEDGVRSHFFNWFIKCRNAIPVTAIDNLQNGKDGFDALWVNMLNQLEKSFERSSSDASLNQENLLRQHIQEAIGCWAYLWETFEKHAFNNRYLLNNRDSKIVFSPLKDGDEFVPHSFETDPDQIYQRIVDKKEVLDASSTSYAFTIPIPVYSEQWYHEFMADYFEKNSQDNILNAVSDSLNTIFNGGKRLFNEHTTVFQWKESANIIAKAPDWIKKAFAGHCISFFNAAIEKFVRTDGKENNLSQPVTVFHHAVKQQVFSGIDLKDIDYNSWNATILHIEKLINDYNGVWFKSFDRKNNIQNMLTKLQLIKSRVSDANAVIPWADLKSLLLEAKSDAAKSDLNQDKWFSWFKYRNTQGSRYQRALNIAMEITQAHLILNKDFQGDALHAEYDELKNNIAILSERAQWKKNSQFLDLLKAFPGLPEAAASSSDWNEFYLQLITLKSELSKIQQDATHSKMMLDFNNVYACLDRFVSHLPDLHNAFLPLKKIQEVCRVSMPEWKNRQSDNGKFFAENAIKSNFTLLYPDDANLIDEATFNNEDCIIKTSDGVIYRVCIIDNAVGWPIYEELAAAEAVMR